MRLKRFTVTRKARKNRVMKSEASKVYLDRLFGKN